MPLPGVPEEVVIERDGRGGEPVSGDPRALLPFEKLPICIRAIGIPPLWPCPRRERLVHRLEDHCRFRYGIPKGRAVHLVDVPGNAPRT